MTPNQGMDLAAGASQAASRGAPFSRVVDMEWMEWVERLGGWAVVVFVCWWMMKRSDVRDKLLQAAFEKLGTAVETFSKIEQQNHQDHQAINDSLKRIEDKVG